MSLITLPHAVFIYDENGNPVPVVSGSTLTSGSRGFVVYGKDGSNQARNFTVDSSGNLLITGSVTVNNFPATQTITGTVNVNNLPVTQSVTGTVGITNFPATQSITGTVGGSGTFNVTGTVSVDNQPTTITVTQLTASELNATITGTVAVQNIDVALSTRLAENTFTTRINTLGQKAMTGSVPVVIASDQTVIPVSDNNGSLTIDNSNLDAALSTLATSANQTNGTQKTQIVSGSNVLVINSSGQAAIQDQPNMDVALSTRLSTAQFTSSVGDVSANPAANTVLGRLKDLKDEIVSRLNVLGQNVMTGSTPVVIASNQSEYPVVQGTATSASNGWPVKVTDGTNYLPTLDVQTRAGFVKLTDGTNNVVTVKTGSVSASIADNALVTALSPNTQLPSGSNTLGYVMQGLSASLSGAWPVIVTDGTNIMPVGDIDSRASFIRISNGTASVDVITGSQTVTTASNSLVVQISPNQEPIPTTVVPATSIAGSSIGRVSGISANTFTAVRQTTYVEQTTNAQRSIVSTSANDSAAGTGARQVRITYLDATGAGPFTETVTLNGLTAVNTVNTNICFIERMDVISVGSNGSNAGTLNLYTATGATGTIFAAIGLGAIATGVGDNQTLYAHHYVPTGYRVSGYYVSCGVIAAAGGGSSTSIIRYRNPTVATSPWMLASDIINAAQGNSAARVYYVSINIPGPLVLLGYSTPGTNNSTLTISFDYADAPI